MGMAMLGGAGYMVGKRRAQSQEASQQQEQSQDDQIQQLQQQQQAQAAPAAPAGGDDLVSRLKDLTDMKSSGALNDAEFEQAKAKLLGGTS